MSSTCQVLHIYQGSKLVTFQNPPLYTLFGHSPRSLVSSLTTMPCALRRDRSIILSTRQAQELGRCCFRPSMSHSPSDDSSPNPTPPSSAPSPSPDLVARVERWLFAEEVVLPTSFFDLPRIESVVYPLTTTNLWFLQGTLVGAGGMACMTLLS